MMGAVRVLANVFAMLGWLVVIGVVLLVFAGGAITAQTLRSPQAGQVVAGILAPYLLYCLVPFFAWGLLTGLCELHGQAKAIEDSVDDLIDSIETTASPATSNRRTDRKYRRRASAQTHTVDATAVVG